MAYWLVKSDPDEYSFADLQRDKTTEWTGIRNHQAKNNLAAMGKGDRVLVYHSQDEKSIVGFAEVATVAQPDSTAEAGEPWLSVQLKAGLPCNHPLSLAAIKSNPDLASMLIIRNSRLSVMPVTESEYNTIVELTSK
ncbi:MAG: EVE domain-containing protein [Candidatus Kapabacteria bacterium]|nr:EVE domain-containing protein [Candidatus Kapabacteria bacterium]